MPLPIVAALVATLVVSQTPPAAAADWVVDGPPPLLVELYTSEGCSSCPPADRWLSRLVGSPRLWSEVVPVAFHVDYWNGLGWRDRFSRAEFTERQRRHHERGAVRQVYTPGLLIDGREWLGFFDGAPLPPPPSDRAGGRLELNWRPQQARLEYRSDLPRQGPLTAQVALLESGLESDVRAGENRGRRLNHDFVVVEFHEATSTTASWRFPLARRTHEGRRAIVAWVTPAGESRPLQVVGGWLEP